MSKFFVISLFLVFVAGVYHAIATKNVIVHAPCVLEATRTRAELEAYAKSWAKCKWQRHEIVAYFKRGFDLNGDDALSMDECEFARNCYFDPELRQFGETCKTVFDRCDCGQDGVITAEDFENSYFTCLKDCEAGERIYTYIGQYLENNTAALTKCRNAKGEFDN